MDEQTDRLWDKAKRLANRPYETKFSEDELSNGEKVHLVENTELPGCMAYGTTLDEALDNLAEARIDFIYYMLVDGLPVPSPMALYQTTGTGNSKVHYEVFEGSGALGRHAIEENTETLDEIEDEATRTIRMRSSLLAESLV